MELQTGIGTVHVTFAAEIRKGGEWSLLAFWGGLHADRAPLPLVDVAVGGKTVRARGVLTFATVALTLADDEEGAPRVWGFGLGSQTVGSPDDLTPADRGLIRSEIRQALEDAQAQDHPEALAALRGVRLREAAGIRQRAALQRADADRGDEMAASMEAEP